MAPGEPVSLLRLCFTVLYSQPNREVGGAVGVTVPPAWAVPRVPLAVPPAVARYLQVPQL